MALLPLTPLGHAARLRILAVAWALASALSTSTHFIKVQSLLRSHQRLAFTINHAHHGTRRAMHMSSAETLSTPAPAPASAISGTVLVTGLFADPNANEVFPLEVLNKQPNWATIVALSTDATSAKRRLISRESRYSGLLDKLQVEQHNNSDSLKEQLSKATAWLSFNTPFESVEAYARLAKSAGVERVVIATQLPPERYSSEALTYSDLLEEMNDGVTFVTIFKHGSVTQGDEGAAYKIVNASFALPNDTIVFGDLARVVSEAVLVPETVQQAYGVGTASGTTSGYLRYVRGKGYSRAQEIVDMIKGGIASYERLVSPEYQNEMKASMEAKKSQAKEEYRKQSTEFDEKQTTQERLEEETRLRRQLGPLAERLLANEWQTLTMAKRTKLNLMDYISENRERGYRLARMAKDRVDTAGDRPEDRHIAVNYDDDKYDATEAEMMEELELRKRFKRLQVLEHALERTKQAKEERDKQVQTLVTQARQAADREWSDDLVQKFMDRGGDGEDAEDVGDDNDADDFDDDDDDGQLFDNDEEVVRKAKGKKEPKPKKKED